VYMVKVVLSPEAIPPSDDGEPLAPRFYQTTKHTHFGRSVPSRKTGDPGSLGMLSLKRWKSLPLSGGAKKYSLGSVLNHRADAPVGRSRKALKQMDMAGEY